MAVLVTDRCWQVQNVLIFSETAVTNAKEESLNGNNTYHHICTQKTSLGKIQNSHESHKVPAGFSWHTAPARDQYCTPRQTHLQNWIQENMFPSSSLSLGRADHASHPSVDGSAAEAPLAHSSPKSLASWSSTPVNSAPWKTARYWVFLGSETIYLGIA